MSKIYFKNQRRLNVIPYCTRIKRERYTLPRSAQGDIGASISPNLIKLPNPSNLIKVVTQAWPEDPLVQRIPNQDSPSQGQRLSWYR